MAHPDNNLNPFKNNKQLIANHFITKHNKHVKIYNLSSEPKYKSKFGFD